MALAPPVVEELRRIVGRESVIDSANDLRIFERDASIEGALPDAVVLASTTAEVAGVIKAAAKHHIPVVPRGAGTGLSGGAVTIHGGIALQVTRMRRIEIDPVGGLEVLVLKGGFSEGGETYGAQSWLRLPIGAHFSARTASGGCRVWIKEGHLRHVPAIQPTARFQTSENPSLALEDRSAGPALQRHAAAQVLATRRKSARNARTADYTNRFRVATSW